MNPELNIPEAEPQQPTITVVVCTRKRPAQLRRCLESLSRLGYPNFDVLVVDNSEGDDQTKDLADIFHASYVLEPQTGLSLARNTGAKHATGELIAYIDDDAIAKADWLNAFAREFLDAKVMAVAGQVIEGGTLRGGLSRISVGREEPNWVAITSFGGVGNGGNLAFRSAAFASWPGFDSRLGRGTQIDGNEEHDAFFQMVRRGHRVVYAPDAIVEHLPEQTLEQVRSRTVQDHAVAVAFALRTLFYGEDRFRTLAYLLGRGPRVWHGDVGTRPRLSWMEKWSARVRGVTLFVRHLLR